jgi:hypothetical protein
MMRAHAIAVDGSGNAYVTGWTELHQLRCDTGGFPDDEWRQEWDVFVTKVCHPTTITLTSASWYR